MPKQQHEPVELVRGQNTQIQGVFVGSGSITFNVNLLEEDFKNFERGRNLFDRVLIMVGENGHIYPFKIQGQEVCMVNGRGPKRDTVWSLLSLAHETIHLQADFHVSNISKDPCGHVQYTIVVSKFSVTIFCWRYFVINSIA